MKSKQSVLRTMTEVAIFASLGYVLDLLAGAYSSPIFPNGGSIGIALVCVFIISFRRGPVAGICTGLIMGLLDVADGFYAIADEGWKVFLQVGLDYWLAYPLAGLAGFFKILFDKSESNKMKLTWLSVGCVFGGLAKYLSHFLSGILFWPGDPWNVGSSYLYSFLYNGAYMLPCIVLSIAILIVLEIKLPKVFDTSDDCLYRGHKKEEETK